MAVGTDQSCQLFRQIAWFLRNNGGKITLSKLSIEFCFTWLALPNYKKKIVHKTQFYINHMSNHKKSKKRKTCNNQTWK